MDPDTLLTLGVVLAVLSVPAALSAISEGRAPRVAALVIVGAGCMIFWAIQSDPSSFTLQSIPDAFIRVAARIL